MNWSDLPFIEYLKAVDDTLEAYYGTTSDPDDFTTIARAHEENTPPDIAAFRMKAIHDA